MATRGASPIVIVEEFEACTPPRTKRRRTCEGSPKSPLGQVPLLPSGHGRSRRRKVTTPASVPGEKRGEKDAGGEQPAVETSIKWRPSMVADAMSVIASIIQHHTCPITQQVLVDPVQAEDGHVYERQALERWLEIKKTSPMTNEPMGPAMAEAVAARQTVRELAEQGMLNQRTSRQFFSERGRRRAARLAVLSGPGPDLEGARSDFERSLELSTSPAEKRAAELQIRAVTWMQDGANILDQARKLQVENGEQELCASALRHGLESWTLHLGEATKAAASRPLPRLSKWQELSRGARVKVADDAAELQRLCERPPPGAGKKVGWVPEMMSFAGQVCLVQQTGEAGHQNYTLRRLGPPAGRDFSFPYDALALLARQEEEERSG